MGNSGASSSSCPALPTLDRFGQVALERGWVTTDQLEEAVKVQNAAAKAGFRKRLGDILVKKGYLTEDQVQQILKRQAPASSAKRKRVADFEILSKLGEGAMGAVYRARQVTMQRDVALKILSAGLAKDPDFRERFLREARAVARLNHPNIVAGIDVGEADGVQYFAMEFIAGESLGQRLERKGGTLPEQEALEYVRQSALALHHAHTHGILHRDVKPDNILIQKDGMAKLADLGLARSAKTDQAALADKGMAVGTPYYISPEQARGDTNLTPGTDLYSLGATLFHLLTGHHPYEGTSGLAIMAKHISQPVPDPRLANPEISSNAARICMKLMEKDPKERYKDGQRLAADLQRVLDGKEPSEAPKLKPLPSTSTGGSSSYMAPVAGGTSHVRAARARPREGDVPQGLLTALYVVGFLALVLVLSRYFIGSSTPAPRLSAPALAPTEPPAAVPAVAPRTNAIKSRPLDPGPVPASAPAPAPAQEKPTRDPVGLNPDFKTEPPPEAKPPETPVPAPTPQPRAMQAPDGDWPKAIAQSLSSGRWDQAQEQLEQYRVAGPDGELLAFFQQALPALKFVAAKWDETRPTLAGKTGQAGGRTGSFSDLTADGLSVTPAGGVGAGVKWTEVTAAERLRLLNLLPRGAAQRIQRACYLTFLGQEALGARELLAAEAEGALRIPGAWRARIETLGKAQQAEELKRDLDALRALDGQQQWEKVLAQAAAFEKDHGAAGAAHADELGALKKKASDALRPARPALPGAEKKAEPPAKKGLEALLKCKVVPLSAEAGHVELIYDFSQAEQLQDFATLGAGTWEVKDGGCLEFSPGNRRGSDGLLVHKARWVGRRNFLVQAKLTFLENRDAAGLALRDSPSSDQGRFVALTLGGNGNPNANVNTGGGNNGGNYGARVVFSEAGQARGQQNWNYQANKALGPCLYREDEYWFGRLDNWKVDSRKRKELAEEWPGYAAFFSHGTRVSFKELHIRGVLDTEWIVEAATGK